MFEIRNENNQELNLFFKSSFEFNKRSQKSKMTIEVSPIEVKRYIECLKSRECIISGGFITWFNLFADEITADS